MKKTAIKAMIVVAVCTTMSVSCRRQEMKQDAGKYKTISITKSATTIEREYTSTLKGVQSVEVRPQVSGTITKILVSEGAKVRKGEVMFVIDPVPYKAALQQAEAQVKSARAQLEAAELELNSKRMLKTQNVIGSYELEQAEKSVNRLRATLEEAEAAALSARNSLSYTEVKSPADGVIGMIPYRVGALVGPSITEPLATVADNGSIYAYFSITEKEMQRILSEHGTLDRGVETMPSARLRMADGKMYDHEGRIDAISGNVDASTGAVTLRATFSNPKQMLRDGGTGTIILPYSMSGTVVIPQEATYELQDKHFVFKVIHGKTKSAEIKVADYNNGKQYIVTSGLSDGDVIIAEGAGLLHDGIEVRTER
ncbi:MAG: efflux RND transporter periplasmic adaptor subunit [Prevotella sp.]